MSLKTWKAEFYPKKPSKRMTDRKALEHSISKWTGLLKKNLEKHGLRKMGRYIEEINRPSADFSIDGWSCALCVKHLFGNGCCDRCPLYKQLGDKRCDGAGGLYQPYTIWINRYDPQPMIKALKDALKNLED